MISLLTLYMWKTSVTKENTPLKTNSITSSRGRNSYDLLWRKLSVLFNTWVYISLLGNWKEKS